jgi:hypothetical protein
VSSSFCALISHSLVKRSLLTYLIVYLRTRSSLIDLLDLDCFKVGFFLLICILTGFVSLSCLADVNDHFLHSDGDMHSYCIDKEHKSCLNTDEDYKSHLGTVQDQRPMGHAPVLRQTNDVELKDTFVWPMSTITFCITMAIWLVMLQTRKQILSKYR